MEKLKIKLENCYGIKKLSHEFDFSNFKTFAIYAPNGVMKTSFAKTFYDYAEGGESKDRVFNRDPYERVIRNEGGTDVDPKGIFVIKSFIDTGYTSDELSTLLVRSDLRERYQAALKALEDAKSEMIRTLKSRTQSTDCEKEIIQTFSDKGDNLFRILERLYSDGDLNGTHREYSFRYNDVFGNDVVKRFVEKNIENLQIYHDKYFEILRSSDDFFSPDGTFGTAQASEIAEAVAGDAFFHAGHKIALKGSRTISSTEDLTKLIDEQIKKIVEDPELRKQFDKIDKALRPKNIRPLKDEIEKDKSLLLELLKYDNFQKNYWKSHLSSILLEISQLNELYSQKKKEIERIIDEANSESDEWKKTIDTFKRRFVDLPFEVSVKNTKDSVLGLNKPELSIQYIDHETDDKKSVERNFLTENILSQGEKRAFYLLNIIFEIRARLMKQQQTLFIIDDIADSFDYKNKYAIIEYLKDLSMEDSFRSIILTHNFDFFRTIQSRILTETFKRSHSFIAERLEGEIKFIDAGSKNITDPFSNWRIGASNNEKHLVACIPFVRNLIDFKRGSNDDDYRLLTHVLHRKNQEATIKATADIKIADLESPFSSVLSNITFSFQDSEKKIISIIEEQITTIKKSPKSASAVLEDKIILAIGIRLKAEEYMWSQISNVASISYNQTRELFERYKKDFVTGQNDGRAIQTLERVNIMTPENIHLNSFMYEPILDMSIGELKNLHDEVSALI